MGRAWLLWSLAAAGCYDFDALRRPVGPVGIDAGAPDGGSGGPVSCGGGAPDPEHNLLRALGADRFESGQSGWYFTDKTMQITGCFGASAILHCSGTESVARSPIPDVQPATRYKAIAWVSVDKSDGHQAVLGLQFVTPGETSTSEALSAPTAQASGWQVLTISGVSPDMPGWGAELYLRVPGASQPFAEGACLGIDHVWLGPG